MAVSGTVLTPMIEEYFNLAEYPEGVPLEAERSLLQIVEYLKTKCNEKGLGEISDAKEIPKSQMTREERKERNINDKVRRAINNNPKISSTKGKTTKKRYKMESGDPRKPIDTFYSDIFVQIEIQGGTANVEGIAKVMAIQAKSKHDDNITEDIDDVSNSSLVFNWTKYFTDFANPTIRKIIGENPDRIGHAAPPFEMIDDTTITSMFENWYTMNPYWMGTKYYGFNGPRGLDSVMNNIGKVIKENQLSEVAENPRLGNEIKWLRANKGRVNNRMIITLALLHLNRTIQESINR